MNTATAPSAPLTEPTLVLGIESSCDETGVALARVAPGQAVPQLLAQGLHSQIDMHQAYGGVVPELASRDHIRRVVPLVRQVMQQALHDNTADSRTSGKEDMVEFQSKQGLIFLCSALKHRHQAGRKGVVQHFLENGGGFCRIARGLHDGAVSRGQRGGQRCQRQLYRIIATAT